MGCAYRLSVARQVTLPFCVPDRLYSLTGTGLVEMARSEHAAAVSSLEEAIALFERCDHRYMASFTRVLLGQALLAQGEGERRRRGSEGGR